jgi:hypothetical protein
MKASKSVIVMVALGSFLAGGVTVLLGADDRHPEISKALEELQSAAEHLRDTKGHEINGHRKNAWDHVQTAITEARLAHEE